MAIVSYKQYFTTVKHSVKSTRRVLSVRNSVGEQAEECHKVPFIIFVCNTVHKCRLARGGGEIGLRYCVARIADSRSHSARFVRRFASNGRMTAIWSWYTCPALVRTVIMVPPHVAHTK